MSSGFSNKPKILRGAFVEYGLTIPPLIVVFQFNPVQLTRSHSLSFCAPQRGMGVKEEEEEKVNGTAGKGGLIGNGSYCLSLRDFHSRDKYSDLGKLQTDQYVERSEETIDFEIRLDATEKLNEGDTITEEFGIAPQLATLELMMYPKDESLIGKVLSLLSSEAFKFTRGKNPPMMLFIWGRKRVLPVNINNMTVTETEFSTELNPIRAIISVRLTVIEGSNIFSTYTKAMTEAMSVLNLANILDIANVIIPM